MRSRALLALLLGVFAASVAAWSKEDHEIFRLRDEVAAANGANITFYDLLSLKPSCSQDDITKAYRKKSRELHPDKARQIFIANYAKTQKKKGSKPGVKVSKQPSKREIDAHHKKATVNYQRLTVIANILKGPERERYDHFLRNGFPAWRGTGYYYARFRPGLGSVILGLFLVMGGGMHYFALVVGWRRRREFVQRYIRHARKTAWGDETAIPGIPGADGAAMNTQNWGAGAGAGADGGSGNDTPDEFTPRNRREKRAMDKENRTKDKKGAAVRKARTQGISTPVEAEITSGPVGAKKRIVAENGKVLIVDSVGNVYLEEELTDGTKGEFLLDPDEEPHPTPFDTAVFKLPRFLFAQTIGRALGKKQLVDEPLLEPASDLPEDEAALQSATSQNLNGEARKRKAKRGA